MDNVCAVESDKVGIFIVFHCVSLCFMKFHRVSMTFHSNFIVFHARFIQFSPCSLFYEEFGMFASEVL
jgi:hypothetical protein